MRYLAAILATLAAAAAGCGITPPPPCTANENCPGGQFCQRPAGECAAVGMCVPMPGGCICQTRPTVGCDGVMYGGGCSAARAGASVMAYIDANVPECR